MTTTIQTGATDITTKSQAAKGYRVVRHAMNLGRGCATGTYRDRVEFHYDLFHGGRIVDSVRTTKALALAILTFEGRTCEHEADCLDGAISVIDDRTGEGCAPVFAVGTYCTMRCEVAA